MARPTRIVVNTSPLTRLGSQFRRRIDEFPIELEEAQRKVGDKAQKIFAASAASRGFQKVAEGVTVTNHGNRLIIEVSAVNPQTGYDYAPVTRFGHRVKYIVPKRRSTASVVATGRRRRHGRRAALQLVDSGGRFFYRRKVLAWQPASDWAEDVMPEVQEVVRLEARSLGRRLARRLS